MEKLIFGYLGFFIFFIGLGYIVSKHVLENILDSMVVGTALVVFIIALQNTDITKVLLMSLVGFLGWSFGSIIFFKLIKGDRNES